MATDFDRLILDQAPGGVVVTTPQGLIVHWTVGAEAIYGYRAGEAIGCVFDELVGLPAAPGNADEIMRELLLKPVYEYECLRRRKDGALV